MAEKNVDRAGKSGWNDAQRALLDKALCEARDAGEPLGPAFESVARQTGRKAGSVRNYYYTVYRKMTGQNIGRTFEVFTEEEIRRMLRFMLRAQAEGKSVRRAALELGNFDKSAMLRYQNKYRSVVKNRPELVLEAAQELRREGIEAPLPQNAAEKRGADACDETQTRAALAAIWKRMGEKILRLPVSTAAPLAEGLHELIDAALCHGKNGASVLTENEALKRENAGLVRQLEMIDLPFDGDALCGGETSPLDRGRLHEEMWNNASRELAVFIPEKV